MSDNTFQALLLSLLALAVAAVPTSADELIQARFRDLRNGVILDSTTRLEWTQSDNGRIINGTDSARYCLSLRLSGDGWRVPTISELETIYDERYSQHCYSLPSETGTCHIHPLFKLTGVAIWSSTPSPYEPKDGRVFDYTLYFTDGRRVSLDIRGILAPFARALCVRPSSSPRSGEEK